MSFERHKRSQVAYQAYIGALTFVPQLPQILHLIGEFHGIENQELVPSVVLVFPRKIHLAIPDVPNTSIITVCVKILGSFGHFFFTTVASDSQQLLYLDPFDKGNRPIHRVYGCVFRRAIAVLFRQFFLKTCVFPMTESALLLVFAQELEKLRDAQDKLKYTWPRLEIVLDQWHGEHYKLTCGCPMLGPFGTYGSAWINGRSVWHTSKISPLCHMLNFGQQQGDNTGVWFSRYSKGNPVVGIVRKKQATRILYCTEEMFTSLLDDFKQTFALEFDRIHRSVDPMIAQRNKETLQTFIESVSSLVAE